MKNPLIYHVILGSLILFLGTPLTAQKKSTSKQTNYKTSTASKNYQKLLELGYSEQAIFEDLGNANFLSKNYETAIFWYKKLKTVSKNGQLSSTYQKRYVFALEETNTTNISSKTTDTKWLVAVKEDYKMNKTSRRDERFNEINFNQKEEATAQILKVDNKGSYMEQSPVAVTADGQTAYFSKEILEKPTTGLFSKKQAVHKIYKANKVNGQWKNIKQVNISPKNYSALHPTVSKDGKRLFFASNMPGSFGAYDIYVANINKNGSLGIAKNLGTKVNTDKNDLYPNLVDGNTLFFASEGRKGYGGMDIYMVQVETKKVGIAINLGDSINSKHDDLAIRFNGKSGMGYVMSNRGKNKNNIQQVAFSYANKRSRKTQDDDKYDISDAFTNDINVDYSSTVFEDE